METLTIPEGCILKGTLDVVENEGNIQMASALVPSRMCSRQGDVTFHAKATMARCDEITAPNGRLTLTAASLTATTLSANHIDITAGECHFENVSAQGTLLIQADEIIVNRIEAGEVTLNGDMIKMDSLVIEGTLTLRANLSMIHEIRAGKVIVQGSIDCKHLVATEGVFVESGSVAIKRLETPVFRAAEEVTGIVAVATTRDVRAAGVRGFLHPDELGMLTEAPAPTSSEPENLAKTALDLPSSSATPAPNTITDVTEAEIPLAPTVDEDSFAAIPPLSDEEALSASEWDPNGPSLDTTGEGDSWGEIPGPKGFPTGSYGQAEPEEQTWGDIPSPLATPDDPEVSGDSWPTLAPAKAVEPETPSFDWESNEASALTEETPSENVGSWADDTPPADALSAWEDDTPQADTPASFNDPDDEPLADDSALASWEDEPAEDAPSSWEDDTPQADTPASFNDPDDEPLADDSALASWDDEPAEDAPASWEDDTPQADTPASFNDPDDESLADDSALASWDDEPAEEAPTTWEDDTPQADTPASFNDPDDEPLADDSALASWDDEPAEGALASWEDDAPFDTPSDLEEEAPAAEWDGSGSPLAAFESYKTRDVAENWELPSSPSGEFDTVALDPRALQNLDAFAARAASEAAFEPSAEAFATDEDLEPSDTSINASSDATLDEDEDSLNALDDEAFPEPNLEDDMAELADLSPDELELPHADHDTSFDYQLEPLNEETFDDVVELEPAQPEEAELEDPVEELPDDNFPETSFDSIDPEDVPSFDDIDVPTLPEDAFEEIPLADSELPQFGDSEELDNAPPAASWEEVDDTDADNAVEDDPESEDAEFNLIKTSELPDLVVPSFNSDYTSDDLGTGEDVEELSPDDLGDLSQSFNDPDEDYLGAPSGEHGTYEGDDEDPLDVPVGDDDVGDDDVGYEDPDVYEDPVAEVEPEEDMASFLPEPIEELDPEEATVRDLSLIMEQIRQYFPEDNYPQFINQILRYLEERRISLFFKESNKNAVLSNFDKFNSDEVSRLARSFFERVDRYRNENA